jgi:prevent-host-death family protein
VDGKEEENMKITPTQAQANVRRVLAEVVNDGAVYELHQGGGPVAVLMPYDEWADLQRELGVLNEAERNLHEN